MTDGSRSGVRAWNPEQWRLRWKVGAVLAVPLIVALLLGGLRISDEIQTSNRLNEAAGNVDVVTAAISLEAITNTVMGGQATATVAEGELDHLAGAIATAQEIYDRGDLGTDLSNALKDEIDTAQTVLSEGPTTTTALAEQAARAHRIQGDTLDIVELALQAVEDSTVTAAKNQLIAALGAQRRLFDEVVGGVAILRNPTGGGDRNEEQAITAESAMVDLLERYYPEDDRRIADLYKGIENRLGLLAQGRDTGVWPLFETRESLLDSLGTYTTLIQNAARTITTGVSELADTARDRAIRDAGIVLGGLLIAIALAILISRSLVAPIGRLRKGAIDIAERDLPAEVDRIKQGEHAADVARAPIPVQTTEEIGQLARAVEEIHGQALRLAGEQADLRLQVNEMFETLARRSKTLVDHQLSLIENMEYEEKDPRLLERLFRLDHLATRMRRNGDNLLILAGTAARKGRTAPVAVVDVLRAAVSEVEDYRRVKLGATPDLAIAGSAASDIVHLLSELLDNAVRASPPASDVTFSFARSQDGGLVIEVSDRGVGIPPAEMAEMNDRLARPAEVGPETARRMGLFVVGRLAERHGLKVRLRATFESAADPGLTVMVYFPKRLIDDSGAGSRPALSPMSAGRPMTPVAPRDGGSNGTSAAIGQSRAATPALPLRTSDTAPATPAPPALPQRPVTTEAGLPQRAPGSTPGLPQRAPGSTELPQRAQPVTGTGLPQREPSSTPGLPQRAPGSTPGLPQRAPGSTELPQRAQPVTGTGLPQREPSSTPGLPQRQPSAAPGLPQRTPGAEFGGAPAARPESFTPSARPTTGAPSARPTTGAPARPTAGAQPELNRHSIRSAKTASFFQSRLEPPVDENLDNPPIFDEMMSAWLVDPATESGASQSWESPADAGWNAARRIFEEPVDERTEQGLPRRHPGRRLVPGGVERSAPATPNSPARRNPDAIRNSLSRHQAGVRDGRAQRTTSTTGDEQA
ncbi:ATP-binding protein [Aldersonia sp. NBC_00410]|uniref:ATP-binding protein n=1 Tax=Aldersonia sp. NBC_00410 TaxID=2975954 RepID=UPI00225C42C1|nr:ATP-binding protein [Aldersonia sp. NBC_00410]MCX5043956.1 ATP-binding protein [Aldersonia sp. NBC_00410]